MVLAAAASCAVFPDEATLPTEPVVAGAAGEEPAPAAGTSGGGSSGGGGGAIASGGAGGQAVTSGGEAPVVDGGSGGQPGGAGGEGGTPVEPACVNRQTVRAVALEDTWIGSAKPGDNHGDESVLSVVAGADEHRLLIAFDLPALVVGASLRQATLSFHLESNANVDLAARELSLHRLTRALNERRATWENFSNGGNNKWTTPGGDFGPQLAKTVIAGQTSSGPVDFDVTQPVAKIIGAVPIPLSLIVRETSQALPPPAELAFTSSEGNASQIAELLLVFCDP